MGLARGQPTRTCVRRIIVSGARGFFGAHVLALVRVAGSAPLAASRRSGTDVRLDVEDRASIRRVLRPGDVVVDATAPFQRRTTMLIEEAVDAGFDVVDLCDNLAYARRVAAFDRPAGARGVRLLNCCSSVSVLSTWAVRCSGIREPVGLHGFLAPATRHTANRGAVESFSASVGRAIEVWRGGAWQRPRGWMESRHFASLDRRGHLIETADSFILPRVFPSLVDVDFWVDPNTRGAAALVALGSRIPPVMRLMSMLVRYGGPVARVFGRADGLLAYEVEGPGGDRVTMIFSGRDSFLMAAIPAAVAARRLATGDFNDGAGVIQPDQQISGPALIEALHRHGIRIEQRQCGKVPAPSSASSALAAGIGREGKIH